MRFSGSHIVPSTVITQRRGFGVHNNKRKRPRPDNDLGIALSFQRPAGIIICEACGNSPGFPLFVGRSHLNEPRATDMRLRYGALASAGTSSKSHPECAQPLLPPHPFTDWRHAQDKPYSWLLSLQALLLLPLLTVADGACRYRSR